MWHLAVINGVNVIVDFWGRGTVQLYRTSKMTLCFSLLIMNYEFFIGIINVLDVLIFVL